MAKELNFEFLGFKDSSGNMYPPDKPPEWMVKKITDAFIKAFQESSRK